MSTNAKSREALLAFFGGADLLVGIIGLGYVGLPLAIASVARGLRVLGFDSDPAKIEQLTRGESYIRHIPSTQVAALGASGRFSATADLSRLGEPDVLLICLPTPLNRNLEPDMHYIVDNAHAIRACLRSGQLVALESTTWPGTCDELLRPILEETGLACGRDFFLAFSPEREDPGNISFGTTNTPKLVGGVDPLSGDLAEAFYARVVERPVRVANARVAEAAKLTENIFRAVNIALVNELKIVYQRMGIDVWQVLDAAETKPFGFMRFNPGPGWGGHCIPVDPFYLAWKAREFGQRTHFIERAGEVNVTMPQWIIGRLQWHLNERSRPLRGSRVLIIGMAYKKNIDDTRESPALEILELLQDQGAEVNYHDPHVPTVPRTRKHPEKEGLRSVPLTAETIAAHDAVVIVTDHDAVDYEALAAHARLLLDSRGVYHRALPHLEHRVVNV